MFRLHETHRICSKHMPYYSFARLLSSWLLFAYICMVVTQVFSGEARNLRGALNEASGVVDDYYYRGKPLSNGTVRLQQ